MRIDESVADTVAVLTLHGDITPDTSQIALVPHVRAALDRTRHVVLDVSDVRYVDSRGIGELIESYTVATQRGGTVKLAGVTTRLNDLLVITKLLSVFEVHETVDAAVRSFDTLVAA